MCHILSKQSLLVPLENMHLECIIPLLAEEGEILRDPRLGLIVTGYCQLQEHDLKQVCFRDCAEENMDKDLQKEEHQNRERPLPLVDITECSETNGGYEGAHGLPMCRPESVNSFLSPKFSPEPSLTDSEKQPMDVATKSDSGSMSERSSNCGERAHLVNMEGDLLVNSHPGTPPCDVSTLHEPISTGSIQIHEHENNRHVNGTTHTNGISHIRKAQRTNDVSWLNHLDVPFSSDTGRNYPCERGVWPGRVIPLNPVTEDTLQDPRLASPKSRPRGEGRFVLTPVDVERSQGENVTCRQVCGNESNSQFSPASGPPPFLDTSFHESNVDIARAKSVEDPTKDVVQIKQEPQEIDTPEERPECESGLSRAQIEQWLAANRRLWDHSFMQSPEVPSEPSPSVYSPSSVLSPLYSPDILSSSPVSSVGGQLPVQVTCPESEEQASPQKESGQVRAAPMRQPGCQNSEPTPVGPELPQAGYPGYHSQHLTPWPTWTYWFPLQPLWSQVPLEQQSLSIAAAPMPSFSVAATMEYSSAKEAPVKWTSEQTLAQSLNQQAPSVSAYPWAFQPSAQAQVESVPQNIEWYSGRPLFLPPQREEVSLSTSVPQQQLLHESSCLPTPAQPSSGLSQLPPYDEPTTFAPPAAQSLVVPQALATDIAYPQAQPELDMPMESEVIESSYVYEEIPPKPILGSDSQATLQEAPIDSEEMQLQSGSQLEPSLAPQGDHSWKYSQVETEIEREYAEQMLTWPEHSIEQYDENLQNEFPAQGVENRYSSSEQEGEHWYSNLYLQQDTESAFTELDPAEGSEMQPSLETQHTSLLLHENPLECSEVPQKAQSAFHLQMAPQEHSSLSVQAQLEKEFQSFPLQETLESTGSYTYSQSAELSATPCTEEQLFRCPKMYLNAQSVASATAQSSESHLLVHPHGHRHEESTPAVCTAPAKEPHFLQPTVQGQGEMRPSAPLPCTAAATGTCVQGPVSSSISCSQPYTVPPQAQCWPTQVMYPVPMEQPVAQCIQSSQLSPLCSGIITAPQSSMWQLPAMNYQAQPPLAIGMSPGMTTLPGPQGFSWQLPAMNCQAQPPWTTGTSLGMTALPGPGVPANGAASFLATFQLPVPHPAPAVPFMPPLPASPPPSKPPLPSVPPPPKSPPPPASPLPNPPTHGQPPLPSSAPPSTPPRSQESPHSSPLQSPQHKENRSRCRSSKYPIWAPSDTKYYREEYHGYKRSGTTSSRSSRSTR